MVAAAIICARWKHQDGSSLIFRQGGSLWSRAKLASRYKLLATKLTLLLVQKAVFYAGGFRRVGFSAFSVYENTSPKIKKVQKIKLKKKQKIKPTLVMAECPGLQRRLEKYEKIIANGQRLFEPIPADNRGQVKL